MEDFESKSCTGNFSELFTIQPSTGPYPNNLFNQVPHKIFLTYKKGKPVINELITYLSWLQPSLRTMSCGKGN